MARWFVQSSFPLVLLQSGVAIGVLAIVSFTPPENGTMLIVSMVGESPHEIRNWAIERHALPLGPGPVPRSLLVVGARSALAAAALDHRAMLLAGRGGTCG